MKNFRKYIIFTVVLFLLVAIGVFGKDMNKKTSVDDHQYENNQNLISGETTEPMENISLVGNDLGFTVSSLGNVKPISDSTVAGKREVRFVSGNGLEYGAPVAMVSVEIVDLEVIKKDPKENSRYQSFLKGENALPNDLPKKLGSEELGAIGFSDWWYEYKLIGTHPYHVYTGNFGCQGDSYGCNLFAYTTYTNKTAFTFSLGRQDGYSEKELETFIKNIILE